MAPIVALQRVRASLDPAVLHGTVLIVHVANLPSFLGRTVYYSPIDGKNLKAEIRAPFGGIVLYVVGTPAMSQGEPMGMIGEPPARSLGNPAPIQTSVLDRFAHMLRLQRRRALEVCDRAGDFENAVIGARR